MTRRGHILVVLSSTIAVGVASLPLAVMCGNSFFGLGAVLLVPVLAVGGWSALRTADRERRTWWLGFTLGAGFCLRFAPVIEVGLHDFALFLQHRVQRGQLSLPQHVIEAGCLLLVLIGPTGLALVVGIAAGKLTRRLVRRKSGNQAAESHGGTRWQFSLRELLIALAAVGALLAWNGRYPADRGAIERQNQQQFLAHFKGSFRSGEVELLAEPAISEHQGIFPSTRALLFLAPGVKNEYRIVAPIRKNGARRWAVWAYTCNEKMGEMVYQFAYAEAEHENQLPQAPFPMKIYLSEGTGYLVDGIPSNAGPTAVVLSVASTSTAGKPWGLTARAPAGTVCELVIYPLAKATSSLPRQSPDKKGFVRWSWVPERTGPVMYELRCIEKRASGPMTSVRRGSIP